MGELFRSQEMQLVQLFVQIEAAHDTVDELGKLGLVQFRDQSRNNSIQQRSLISGYKTLFGNFAEISKDGKKKTGYEIQKGKTEWPICFQLPKSLPPTTSFEQKRKIYYIVEVILQYSDGTLQRSAATLNIGIPYKINFLSRPVLMTKSSIFGGSMKAEVSLDSHISYGGSTVNVSVSINTKKEVKGIVAKLKQTWTYGGGYFEKYTVKQQKLNVDSKSSSTPFISYSLPFDIPDFRTQPTVHVLDLDNLIVFI